MKHRLVLCLFCVAVAVGWNSAIRAEEVPTAAKNEQKKNEQNLESAQKKELAADFYMKLGTPSGVLGGENQQAFERRDIKSQILSFIPPLLRPAFVQHAFVLPPSTFELSVAQRFMEVNGNDFFLNGRPNLVEFKDRTVRRHITDFDIAYGFDLDHDYLHAFTLNVNVPFIDTSIGGAVHPPENPMVTVEAIGSSQEIGDVTVALKKRLIDQGDFPFGLAAVVGISLPTGSNHELFGNNGMANMIIPGMPLMSAVFDRFSNDGRLPAPLQPGTGGVSYLAGTFLTRQFSHGDLLGRSALHLGVAHQFVSKHDGVDLGDTTTVFASYVKPIYKDYLAVDLTFVGFHKEDDSYDGLRASATMLPLGSVTTPRESFSGGFTGFIAPSLIFSPSPQLRFTGSVLFRVIDPDLGPAPDWVARVGASGIF